MKPRQALPALLLAAALVTSACDAEPRADGGPPPPSTTPPPEGSPSRAPGGPGSAQAAREALCEVPPPSGSDVAVEGPTPPAIAEIEREVEEVRGLEFIEPVSVDPITQEEMVAELGDSFDESFPQDQYERRSVAWQTIGVIPSGTSIREELQEFQEGQVFGFYVPSTGQLVFIGAEEPSPLSHVILAHELTHAIDDQHFGLRRLDGLAEGCSDEAFEAAVGAVEGNAQLFSFDVAARYLTLEERLAVVEEAGAQPLPDVPEFIMRLEVWPYEAGFSFMSQLRSEGGVSAVNEALTNFPLSTEQILHPERYPNDLPTPLDVPDMAPGLGEGWEDLDVMDVGESWLSIMLDLRLDGHVAENAAAGWDGGIYRAWRNGDHVALVLSTVWDTPGDAQAFGDAMRDWIQGGRSEVLPVEGSAVRVLFASDGETLDALETAA